MGRTFLYVTFICLTIYNVTSGQSNRDKYVILTVQETLTSNNSIRTHHFISREITIRSAYQFNELYFDQMIDLSLKKRCAMRDTIPWLEFYTIWNISVVKDFGELDGIVSKRSAFLETRTTEKSKLDLYITSVSGQFCQCFLLTDNGAVRPKYLPVSGFKENLDLKATSHLNDFDSFWKEYRTQ
jgi:hypothetical protein